MKTKLMTAMFATIALSGCGGGDGGKLSASGSATGLFASGGAPSAITNFGTFLQNNPMDSLPDDLSNNNSPFVAMAQNAFSHCKTFLIGTAETDDHYKIKYTCEDVDTNDGVIDWLGTKEINVYDPTNYADGYKQTYDLEYSSTTDTFYQYNKYVGYNEFKNISGRLIFDSDFKIKTKMNPHDPEVDWEFHRQVYIEFKPDDVEDPAATGETIIDAHYKVYGKIGGDSNGNDLGTTDVTFSVTSKDLRYDKNCAKGYDSGTITFADGSGGKAVVTYSCATASTTWNGTTITW